LKLRGDFSIPRPWLDNFKAQLLLNVVLSGKGLKKWRRKILTENALNSIFSPLRVAIT